MKGKKMIISFLLTNHESFDMLILNKSSVLEVAFTKHRCYKNSFTKVKEMTLKKMIFFITIISLFFI